MIIGVLSDSHDQLDLLDAAIVKFQEEKIDLLVHCGDWVAPFTLVKYQALHVPIKGVFGNNDGDKFRFLRNIERYALDVTMEDRFLSLDIDGKHIAVWHGDYEEITQALITSGRYDAVFHGHTHRVVNTVIGRTLSLNPGSLLPQSEQGSTIAIYSSDSNSAQIHTLA